MSPPRVCRTTTCSGDACLASDSAPRFCAGVPTGTTRRRGAHRPFHRSALWILTTRTRLSGTPKTCTQSWGAHPARCLRTATDTDPDGLAVHDHQRRAAATLAVTLEELGDRVAVYAFRSQGRHAVHLPAIKPSDNVSAPSGGLGSTSSNHRAIRASAPAFVERAKFSRPRPAHQIGCWSSFRMVFLTTMATKVVTRKPTPKKPLKSSARMALPAYAFPSAPPLTPMRSNASSVPRAMPAPRRWRT